MAGGKNVVIIGAGVGGLTTALFLAKEGYKVDIYEKNPSPGGRCGQFIKEGHRFDLGATMLLMPDVYREVFSALEIPLETGKDILPLEDLYKIYFDDRSHICFTKDVQKMREQLEKVEKGSADKAEKYVEEGYKIYKLGMEKLVGRNFYNLFQFANFKNIGLLIKLKTYISNWKFARRYFANTHLAMAYTFQNIYVGQSPYTSPALFSMIPAAELREGSYFPAGGMYTIIDKLEKTAIERGVSIHYNIEIKKLETDGKKVTGVILEDGARLSPELIIANADLPYVYRELLPDHRKSAHIEKLKHSCSAICFHWGLDKEYPQLGHHSVFLSDMFKEGLDKIFIDKSVNERPSFYVHAPTRTDKFAAPSGEDTLSVIVGAGHLDPEKGHDWQELRQKTHDAVIKRLVEQGLTDIEEHIKFEICYTPESWESACHVSRGAVFGSLGHNIMQMGYFRPHNRHDKYKNLYFTGGSTHPGNGIPNVLMSAKLVSERIISGR